MLTTLFLTAIAAITGNNGGIGIISQVDVEEEQLMLPIPAYRLMVEFGFHHKFSWERNDIHNWFWRIVKWRNLDFFTSCRGRGTASR